MGARDDRVSGDRLSSRRSGVPSSVMSTGIRPVCRIPVVDVRLASEGGPVFACPTSDVRAPTSPMASASRLARGRRVPKTSDRDSLVADQTTAAHSRLVRSRLHR